MAHEHCNTRSALKSLFWPSSSCFVSSPKPPEPKPMWSSPLDLLDLTCFGANFSLLHSWTSCLHLLHSLPLLMSLLFFFFGLQVSLFLIIFGFFHFSSLEVGIFLQLLLEDPFAIHRASDWKSQNTPFFLQYYGWSPVFMSIFFLQRGAQTQKKLNTLSYAREEIHHSSENVQVYFSTEQLSMFLIELNVYNHSVHVEEPCWLTRE